MPGRAVNGAEPAYTDEDDEDDRFTPEERVLFSWAAAAWKAMSEAEKLQAIARCERTDAEMVDVLAQSMPASWRNELNLGGGDDQWEIS